MTTTVPARHEKDLARAWITALQRHGAIHQADQDGDGWVIQLTSQAGAMTLPNPAAVLELVAHLQRLQRHPRSSQP